MGFDRRTFLQQAGLALLTLGASQTGLSSLDDDSWVAPWIKRYYQTLAQPTSRKLALLVGINEYPYSTGLSGCVTDVELQRELLIHRFGFNPQDILTLTGQQTTRKDIETAFIEHLTEQARATDVVVFHFSGYGTQVKVPQWETRDYESSGPAYRLVNSLVPRDGMLPTNGTPAPQNNLLEQTLVLLARLLATDKLTIVLDTSYRSTGKVLQGNLRVRSFPTISEGPSPEELAFQEQLQNRINSSSQEPLDKRSLEMPGIVLSAALESRVAAEAQWYGFSAGLFTYALTQYLWQVTPASTVLVSVTRTAEKVERVMGKQQQPRLKGVGKQPRFTYYLMPEVSMGGEGVVTAVEDNGTAQIHLAGLPGTVLENYGISSCLTLVSPPTAETPQQDISTPSEAEVKPDPGTQGVFLQIFSREGLRAKARLVRTANFNNYPLQVGQLVQELVRVFPRNLGLTVALDADLERIERVDATSAFSNISAVSWVVNAGGQAADCLLGKMKETLPIVDSNLVRTAEDIPAWPGSYGLFSIGGVLIPNTAGIANEAVKSAVYRLVPQLKTLLAAKLWRLTVNEGSSRLGVRATLEIIKPKNQKLIRRETLRQSQTSGAQYAKPSQMDLSLALPSDDDVLEIGGGSHYPKDSGEGNNTKPASTFFNQDDPLPTLSIGSQIQYRLENYSDRPIYLMLLGIDSGGNAIALYSPQLNTESDPYGSPPQLKNRLIAPGETLIVPQPSTSLNWIVTGPIGLAEIQIICSQAPFAKTLETLSAMQYQTGDKEQVVNLPNPLEVAHALLQDLHAASAVSPEITWYGSDVYAMDVNAWATLSFVYQVV
ncbi:MAG: caspase family protein [Xenococcaceae cyanobacterium]